MLFLIFNGISEEFISDDWYACSAGAAESVETHSYKLPSAPRVLLLGWWLLGFLAHTFLMSGLPIC